MLVRVRKQLPLFDFPFHPVLDRDLDYFFNNLLEDRADIHQGTWVNIAEDDSMYLLTAAAPGLKKEDISLTVKDGHLTISGERKKSELPKGSRWIRNEIQDGRFTRTVLLPGEVHVDGISAELTDGLLKIVLPKSEAARSREITIR